VLGKARPGASPLFLPIGKTEAQHKTRGPSKTASACYDRFHAFAKTKLSLIIPNNLEQKSITRLFSSTSYRTHKVTFFLYSFSEIMGLAVIWGPLLHYLGHQQNRAALTAYELTTGS
jgi:hypothetical protein